MSYRLGYIGNNVYIVHGLRGYEISFKDNNRKYIFSYDQGPEPYAEPDLEDEYNSMLRRLEKWAYSSNEPDSQKCWLSEYNVTKTQREDAKCALYAIDHQEEYEREQRFEDDFTMEEEDEPISIELITN